MEFETVIGLEIHTQLSTVSKIFCSCSTRPQSKSVGEELSNTHLCPICAAHPGTLPVLNEKVIEFATKAALATHSEIALKNVFARKNYFYPDLPKGYQISQYNRPFCQKGKVEILSPQRGNISVRLNRIHIEEDAGKNLHFKDYSLVNLNRAGVPLLEIVSEPDLRFPEEASEYLRTLHAIVTYLEICEGNLQEGNLRCDANVSVRPVGSSQYGTRTEIKNLNSFRFLEKAIRYESARQIEVIKSGGKIKMETRGYDAAQNVTFTQRSKEEAQDYRYFPDPDLLPITLDSEWIEKIRQEMPELPAEKKRRFESEWALTPEDAALLVSEKPVALFFEKSLKLVPKKALNQKLAHVAAQLMKGEILRLLHENPDTSLETARIQPAQMATILELLGQEAISYMAAKQVILKLWEKGGEVLDVVEREGFRQSSDVSELEPVIDSVLAQFPQQVEEYRQGKEKVLTFLMGQIMKQTKGKSNPRLLQNLVVKKLQTKG